MVLPSTVLVVVSSVIFGRFLSHLPMLIGNMPLILSIMPLMVLLALSSGFVIALLMPFHAPDAVDLMPCHADDSVDLTVNIGVEIAVLMPFHTLDAVDFRAFHILDAVDLIVDHTPCSVLFACVIGIVMAFLIACHADDASDFNAFHTAESTLWIVLLTVETIPSAAFHAPDQSPLIRADTKSITPCITPAAPCTTAEMPSQTALKNVPCVCACATTSTMIPASPPMILPIVPTISIKVPPIAAISRLPIKSPSASMAPPIVSTNGEKSVFAIKSDTPSIKSAITGRSLAPMPFLTPSKAVCISCRLS